MSKPLYNKNPELQRLADGFTLAVNRKLDQERHVERVTALAHAEDYDAFINVCLSVFSHGMDKKSFSAFMANTILVGYDMAHEEEELKKAVPDLNFLETLAGLKDPRCAKCKEIPCTCSPLEDFAT